MKNKLLLNSIRKIRKNYKRFLSLLFMSFLGVGFYTGIQATSPSMIKTLDEFYDEVNMHDIEVVSNVGLTDDDISKIKESKLIKDAYGINYIDKFITIDDTEYVGKIFEINNDVDKPILLGGKLPDKENEIALEENALTLNKLKIGDSITIEDEKYKIVGTVLNPNYFSTARPSSTLGSGQVDYFAYVDSLDQTDYYSSIYVVVDDAKDEETSSDEYKTLIDRATKYIENIKDEQEEKRYDELYSDYIEYSKMMGITDYEDNIVDPVWYIFDRSDISAYNDLVDASENMNKLGNVFPLVFFVISILISLISMMRMVEEERLENGCLKALGFNNTRICLNYFLYSFLATVIGGVIGFIFGNIFLPTVIWDIYTLLFSIPEFVLSIDIVAGIIGLGASILCICGTALYVSYKTLKDVPATLMRPKSPKEGKKILLEHIPFIWKRLKFSNKVVVRNIFRYKSRVAATIIGIAGCTALILSGFGLKDSIQDVAYLQFNDIFYYDESITISGESDEFVNNIKDNKKIIDVVKTNFSTITIEKNDIEKDIVLITPENEKELSKVIDLKSIENDKKAKLKDNEIVISEKIAKLFDVEIGDKLKIYDDNDNKKDIIISDIVYNYVNLYAYVNTNTYNELFKEYEYNTLLINFNTDDHKKIDDFNENISSNNNEVLNITITSDVLDSVTDMMESLNSVVVILIIAAAILAFVVLYNLSNINICERQREIATLKVLGFHNKEVDSYITKENILLTILGIPIGLIIGYYLTYFIISTCETDILLFVRNIKLFSFIASICITIVFTIIVNIITHFNLKKIDMIESLKNVE